MGSIGTCHEADVVVVGAGPTGLLSAVLARQLGLSVHIIDAKDGPLELGRADALNARTQQYLEVSGTLETLLSEGLECNTSSIFSEGKFISRQDHWWTSLSHTYRRNFLMIGQPRVENALSNQLDVPVEYGSRAVSIQESSCVITRTSTGSIIKSKYAIAADGAKSFVRNLLEIPFVGTQPGMVWAVLDTFIDTDFPTCPEIITFQVDGQARVSWIPRERGMARFYVLLDGEITQEKAEESIQLHMAPYKVNFRATEWFSQFEVKERVASSFVSKGGRIFLAGDAAHVHAVNGGQGLNTGLADAFSLMWRIAFVVKGQAGPALLRNYDTERRQVATSVVDVAAKLVRSTTKTAQEYVQLIEKNASYITGMGISYAAPSILVYESKYGPFVAGQRCPDLEILSVSGGQLTSQRLYSHFRYGKYVVLLLGSIGLRDLQEKLWRYQELAVFWHIHSDDDPISNLSEFKADWVHDNESAVVVIRPDLYIGVAGDGWEQYLDSVCRLDMSC